MEAVLLDAQGNILNSVDFNYKDRALCFSSVLEVLDDGNILLAAQHHDTTTDTSGILLAKLDPALNTIWTKGVDVRGIFGYPIARIISLTHPVDGNPVVGFVVARGFMDVFSILLKLDGQGNRRAPHLEQSGLVVGGDSLP